MERKLLEIYSDKKKIFLYIVIRMPILALVLLAFIAGSREVDNPLEIQWSCRKGYITGNRQVIYKQGKSIIEFLLSKNDIDVTYMTEPKEQFIRCYMNNISIANNIKSGI